MIEYLSAFRPHMTLKSKNGMYFSVSAGLPPRGLLLYHGEGVNFVSL